MCQSIIYHYNTVISYRSIFCAILLSPVNNGGDEMPQFPKREIESSVYNFSEKMFFKFLFILI